MTSIIIHGACGKMGRVVADIIQGRNDCRVVAGVDVKPDAHDSFPVVNDIMNIQSGDVLIDFSHPSALGSIIAFAQAKKIPVVLATTGYTQEQIVQIKESAKMIPIFFTFNMSLGINLLSELSKQALKVLGSSFDIEIIEKHHNQKIDAPSGTAYMLADALNQTLNGKYSYVYDRHSVRKKRDNKEIGIHSVRGGTIVGEHEVIFAGRDEIITLSHSALSKEVFASGAVNAALFMKDKKAGLYDMSALLSHSKE